MDSPLVIITPLFSVTSGIVLCASVMAFCLAYMSKKHNKKAYLSLSLLCFLTSIYQLTIPAYLFSNSIETSIFWLKFHYTLIELFWLALVLFATSYTRIKLPRWSYYAMGGTALGLITYNLVSDYSLRFNDIDQIASVAMAWGEVIHLTRGEASLVGNVWTCVILSVTAWIFWRHFKRYRSKMVYWIIAFYVLLVLALVQGRLIDIGYISSFYTLGFAIQILVLFFCVSTAIDIRRESALLRLHEVEAVKRNKRLQTEIKSRKRIEAALTNLAKGVKNNNSEAFFNELVVSLAASFSAQYAFIGMRNEHNTAQIDTLSVVANGELVDGFSYSLKGTPCEYVIDDSTCVYSSGVTSAFPEDELLVDMGVEGYIGSPLIDEDGNRFGLIAVLDSAELKEIELMTEVLEIFAGRAAAEVQRLAAESKIRTLAYYDYLTTLPNHAAMHTELVGIQKRTLDKGYDSALLYIDLDNFKSINDNYGNDVADAVLRQIGSLLKEQFSNDCFVARVGGDEFALLYENITTPSEWTICLLAEAIIKAFSAPLQVGDRLIYVSSSVGAALFPKIESHKLNILRFAETALQQAKDKGRNCYQIFDPELQRVVDDKIALERDLRKAIENDDLTLYYQPQISMSGHVSGAEALIRWIDPERGFVPPDVFIPLAEETGLIHRIGTWVFEHAFKTLNAWETQGFDFKGYLSINVSAWQFSQPDFVKSLIELTDKYSIQHQIIVLELTETGLLQDVDDAVKKLTELRTAGFKIALDDFGTGYSSLAYLKDLPLDILKIDRAFIEHLNESENIGLVESMLSICKHMNLTSVAEGIELAEHWLKLIEMGCECYQGYYFSRPINQDDFAHWVKERELTLSSIDSLK